MDVVGQRGACFSKHLRDLGRDIISNVSCISNKMSHHLSFSFIAQWPELVTWFHSNQGGQEVPSRERKQNIWWRSLMVTTRHFVWGCWGADTVATHISNIRHHHPWKNINTHRHAVQPFLSPVPPTPMWLGALFLLEVKTSNSSPRLLQSNSALCNPDLPTQLQTVLC